MTIDDPYFPSVCGQTQDREGHECAITVSIHDTVSNTTLLKSKEKEGWMFRKVIELGCEIAFQWRETEKPINFHKFPKQCSCRAIESQY